MLILRAIGVLTLFSVSIISCAKYTSIKPFYDKAVKAYKEERWSECIVYFEEALHLYKLHKSIGSNCHHKCNSQSATEVKDNIEDLNCFESSIKRKVCLRHCKVKDFGDIKLDAQLEEHIHYDLRDRVPYQYLHHCYYKIDDLATAASAAYTYLMAHPDDQDGMDSLTFYMTQPGLHGTNNIIDLESDNYMSLYGLGRESYVGRRWGETAAAMEEVAADFLSAENKCRAECQDLTEQKTTSDFIDSLGDNIKTLLVCKQKCQDALKQFQFESGIIFLGDVLNHLQICYYHLDRVGEAARAVETSLAMFPADPDMNDNKHMYLTLVGKESFVERPDILFYYKRDKYEKYLLKVLNHADSQIENSIYM